MSLEKRFLFLNLTVVVGVAIWLIANSNTHGASCVFRVLTYAGFSSPGSLGAEIKSKFEKSSLCSLEYVVGGSSSQLQHKILLQPSKYDAVIGIQFQTESSRQIKWKSSWKLFSHSPMVLLQKREGAKRVIVPNPSNSEVGKLFFLMGLEKSNKTRFASSWSQSIGFFEKAKNDMLFTFLGTFFYLSKAAADQPPLLSQIFESNYREFFVALSDNKEFSHFERVVLSSEIQTELWKRSYMLPLRESDYPEELREFLFEQEIRFELGSEKPLYWDSDV